MALATDLANGRWHDLLVQLGIEPHLLTGRHAPCPACGGRDRFRFDDKGGRGTFFCSHCGAGDGFKLLSLVKDWSFRKAAQEIERLCGNMPARTPTPERSDTAGLEGCRRVWRDTKAATDGDPVHLYLRRRTAIDHVPSVIRSHPRLAYRYDDGSVTLHPAMVAKVTDASGRGCAIHRTYLTAEGNKASVPTVKKVLGNMPASSAIRLFDAGCTLGIAEGVETALSASIHFGVPVWSAVSAGGMEKWTPPEGVERVIVFGDNDTNGVGQAASWSLAKRLIAKGMDVDVKIPEMCGDWNDQLRRRV